MIEEIGSVWNFCGTFESDIFSCDWAWFTWFDSKLTWVFVVNESDSDANTILSVGFCLVVAWQGFDIVVHTDALLLNIISNPCVMGGSVKVNGEGFLSNFADADDIKFTFNWWRRKLNFCRKFCCQSWWGANFTQNDLGGCWCFDQFVNWDLESDGFHRWVGNGDVDALAVQISSGDWDVSSVGIPVKLLHYCFELRCGSCAFNCVFHHNKFICFRVLEGNSEWSRIWILD